MTGLGRIVREDGDYVLVQTRTFRARIEDVWAAVTEPDRLARWIGTWTGDPASGQVQFRMLFEGDGHEGETMEIRACVPPHRLHLTSRVGEAEWFLELELTHADGITTLTFRQPGVTQAQVGSVAPGWDYYLDRLIDVESGADPSLRNFERDYYPATSDHYSSQAAFGTG